MTGDSIRPPRKSAVTALVWDFLEREDRADGLHSIRTPILLLTGVRGTGKTELLTDLRGLLAENFPHAYVNGEWPFESTTAMLALLAFDLNQQRGYGKLAFPRLVTGEIATNPRIAIDPLDRDEARRHMVDVLAAHRRVKGMLEDSIRTILSSALTPVLAHGAVPLPSTGTAVPDVVSKYGMEALLGHVVDTRRGRAALLGTGQEWWGHQDQGLRNDPIDELVNLRMDADRARAQRHSDEGSVQRDAGADSRRMVIKRLWAAFLADLRDGFGDRRRARGWTRNCVLLLDNADTPIARAFLEELVKVRKDRDRQEPDPLTVVATSRGGLASRVSAVGLTPLAAASVAQYRTRTGAAAWWYPILLPALNWPRTRTMVDALALPGVNSEAVTAAVHGFTSGHPAATSTLLKAMAAYPELAMAVNLPGLLAAQDLEAVGEHERTVEEALLHDLLANALTGDQAPANDLATCAAARHREAALRLATDSGLLEESAGEVGTIFAGEFWPADPAGGHTLLHPPLRRLLTRQLAARPAEAKVSWARAHLWLRRRALEDGQEDAALYHTLALAGTEPEELARLLAEVPAAPDPLESEEPLEHVASRLARCLETDDAAAWLDRVTKITAAPARLDPAPRPRDQVGALTEWVDSRRDPAAPAARYVAYCWLGPDPLRAPYWRWLLRQMASELDRMAPYSDDKGLTILRAKAEYHRYLADGSWEDIEEFWMKRETSR